VYPSGPLIITTSSNLRFNIYTYLYFPYTYLFFFLQTKYNCGVLYCKAKLSAVHPDCSICILSKAVDKYSVCCSIYTGMLIPQYSQRYGLVTDYKFHFSWQLSNKYSWPGLILVLIRYTCQVERTELYCFIKISTEIILEDIRLISLQIFTSPCVMCKFVILCIHSTFLASRQLTTSIHWPCYCTVHVFVVIHMYTMRSFWVEATASMF